MTDGTSAVGYIRLSEDGKSLPRQRREVEDSCERHGFELVDVVNEGRMESGYDADRQKYQAMLQRAFDGEYDAIVVPNLARLSRDRIHRMRVLFDLHDHDIALAVYELNRIVDLEEDWELVQQAVMATADDLAKRKEIERAKHATEQRLEKGYDHGRPPFGLQFDDDGQYWIPDEDFETALAVIRHRNSGMSWREIANETGVKKTTVRRIFERREKYLEIEQT